MNYKVVPFIAHIDRGHEPIDVARQFEDLINEHATNGWEYVRLEVVETQVAPDHGCFGIGAKEGFNTVFRMVVFKK